MTLTFLASLGLSVIWFHVCAEQHGVGGDDQEKHVRLQRQEQRRSPLRRSQWEGEQVRRLASLLR